MVRKYIVLRSPGVGQNKGLRLPTQRCVMTKVYPVVKNVYLLLCCNEIWTLLPFSKTVEKTWSCFSLDTARVQYWKKQRKFQWLEMFCLYTLPLARPAQAKIQMLTTSSWIATILLKSLVNFSRFSVSRIVLVFPGKQKIKCCQLVVGSSQ